MVSGGILSGAPGGGDGRRPDPKDLGLVYDRLEGAPAVTSFYMRVLSVVGLMCVAAAGGSVGSLIVNKRYPIQIVERANLTPSVKPGDSLLLAQHANRVDQCDVVVKRTVKTSSGQRFFIKQEFDEGFGPLGGDRYILPIEMPAGAAFGPAEMYSKAYSYCNWLDHIKPSEAEAWTEKFYFAEATTHAPPPPGFDQIGVKEPRR